MSADLSTRRHQPIAAPDAAEQWETELDRLEVEVLWAERVLQVMMPLDASDWVPRSDIPPLPAHLAARAQELLQRQQEVGAALATEMKQLLRVRQLADAERPDPLPAPRYLDVVG